MSLINLVRIDSHSGVMLADEEFWRKGSRRTLSLDNLQSLLPDDYCERKGIEAVIGLEGDPSITFEIILRARKRLADIIKDPSQYNRDNNLQSLREIADITVQEICRLIHKRINDQLGFIYGFTAEDFIKGYFEENGQRIDIKQEIVRSDALRWIKYDEKNARTRMLFETSVIIAGVDEQNGFHWYEWSGTPGNTLLGTGLFDSIGKGSDAANLAFIDIFRKRDLKRRRQGMSPEEALFAVLEALEAAARFNHEVGGYPHIILFNGRGKTHAERLRDYSGHSVKLAQEIVTAWVHGYIPKSNALRLIRELILDNRDFNDVEAEFMQATPDAQTMEHFLRGYKNSAEQPDEEIME